ncbi:MAG: hypothetical protein JO148_14935 [Acidimicrobiia bacterium]|nr:hypothetical protein [Acidimicrobiia bacterium]
MPGIPVGPGTIFYLLAALLMPLVGVGRRLAGRPTAESLRPSSRQAAVALGMVLSGALAVWVFDTVGSRVDGHHPGKAMLLLSSPLLVALIILVCMVGVSRVMRRLSR